MEVMECDAYNAGWFKAEFHSRKTFKSATDAEKAAAEYAEEKRREFLEGWKDFEEGRTR